MLFNGMLRKHIKLFGTICSTMIKYGNKLSQTWKKNPDAAYQDVFDEFHLIRESQMPYCDL